MLSENIRKDIKILNEMEENIKFLEKRRNPEQNPKITPLNQIIKFYESFPDNEKKNYFISFTNIDKLGINPQSPYDTPLGIYAYPIKYVIDNAMNVPFAGNEPYINIFKIDSNKVVDLNNMTKIQYDKFIKLLSKLDDNFTDNNFPTSTNSVHFGREFWNKTREVANENPKKWNGVFRKIGVYGCIDYEGEGIIYPDEETQGVFFSKEIISNIQRINNFNKHYSDSNFIDTIKRKKPNEQLQQIAVQQNGLNIKSIIDSGIKPSEEVQRIAVKQNGRIIEFIINAGIKPSEEVQRISVKQNGLNIKSIIDSGIEPSEEVQKLSVQQIGRVIEDIIDSGIKPSETVKRLAVQQNGRIIGFINNPSEEVQILAVKQNGSAIEDIIDFGIKPSEKVQRLAVQQNGRVIEDIIDSGIKPSEEVQKLAVQQDGYNIEFIINADIKPSEEVQKLAVQQDGPSIKYISSPSETVQRLAVQQNGFYIKYISSPSETVQRLAVQQNGSSIKYISSPSEEIKVIARKNG